MSDLAENHGVFKLLRLLAPMALPLVFFMAFALNAMAMSKAMPITAPSDSPAVFSLMQQHAAEKITDAIYCQQMVQCTAVLAVPDLNELTLALFRLPRLYMAEYGLGRTIWPPIHPPIV